MRKIISYLLLFIYSMVMFKPAIPYINDLVAHIFDFHEHMATIHAHHGKYHVHDEVAETAKNENTEKGAAVLKKEAPGNEHTIASKPEQQFLNLSILVYYILLSDSIESINLNTDFPPPRV